MKLAGKVTAENLAKLLPMNYFSLEVQYNAKLTAVAYLKSDKAFQVPFLNLVCLCSCHNIKIFFKYQDKTLDVGALQLSRMKMSVITKEVQVQHAMLELKTN